MANEGNLKDQRLPNLIQTICLDQRNTVIRLENRQCNGLIACNGGQIVHAETGNLQGEEAIYELLSWTEGSFRLSDNFGSLPQTINNSWSAVLMEGMRRLDEHHANPIAQPQPVISPKDIARDSALESKLIVLFASLDQMLVRLGSKETQKDIPLALRILTDMVNQVIQFSETEFWTAEVRYAEKGTSTLDELLKETTNIYPLTRLIQTQHNRLSVSAISRLCSALDGDPVRRKENLYQVVSAMVYLIENYIKRFMLALRTPDIRNECQDVADTFIADLVKLTEKLAL